MSPSFTWLTVCGVSGVSNTFASVLSHGFIVRFGVSIMIHVMIVCEYNYIVIFNVVQEATSVVESVGTLIEQSHYS